MKRNVINVLPVGESAQATEARVYKTKPARYTGRRPKRSLRNAWYKGPMPNATRKSVASKGKPLDEVSASTVEDPRCFGRIRTYLLMKRQWS